MKDRGLDILLIVLFGVGGITILILTWVIPLSEKIMPIFVGTLGLMWAFWRAFGFSKK